MFYSKNKKQTNTKKGFTLIEALVAISILMIAIASPMLLAQKSLSSANLSKDQMIATFLAQDAIEAVKNIRDEIAINGSNTGDWLDKLEPCVCDTNEENEICDFDIEDESLLPSLKFCTIDTISKNWTDTIKKGSATDGSNILKVKYIPNLDGTESFIKYDYTGDKQTKFTRYINIQKIGLDGNEARVKVRVTWNSTLGTQKIDLEDFIYNYSENIEDTE